MVRVGVAVAALAVGCAHGAEGAEGYSLVRGEGASFDLRRGEKAVATIEVLLLDTKGVAGSSRALKAEDVAAGGRKGRYAGVLAGKRVVVGLGRRRLPGGAASKRSPVFAEVELPDGAEGVADVAVAVSLPARVWAGGRVTLGSAEARPLSVQRGGRGGRRLVTGGEAFRIAVVSADGKDTLSIEKTAACKVEVEDLRNAGNAGADAFRVLLYLPKPEGWAGAGSVLQSTLHVGRAPYPKDGPLLVRVSDAPKGAERYGRIDLEADVFAPGADVFDRQAVRLVARVTGPTKLRWNVQGFFSRRYSRKLVGEGDAAREVLMSAGEGRWRVSFVPRTPGEYTVALMAATPKAREVHKLSFTVKPSARKGFILPSATDARYLERSDGSGFFAVGVNLCWPDKGKADGKGLYDYEAYFDELSKAGVNCIRVWSSNWWCPLDGDRPGRVNLESAWRLEELLRLADAKGIAVRLCLENFWDFTRNRKENVFFDASRGGMCRRGRDFFTLMSAWKAYRRKLDYLVARYGAQTNLFAWELWNEMNYVLGDNAPPRALEDARSKFLVPWTAQMAAYIGKIDRGQHMVTTSLGGSQVWPELWRLDSMDLCQIHTYIPASARAAGSLHFNAADLAFERLGRLEGFMKPMMVSEFGFAPDLGGGSNKNTLNEKDPLGIHLHNAIWATSLGGSAGCAQLWWWDHYIRPNGLWHHYSALSKFIAGIDFAKGRFARLTSPPGAEVTLIGLKNGTEGYVWLQNSESTWRRRIIEKTAPEVREHVKLGIPNVEDGNYQIEWWDTYLGKVKTTAEQRPDKGVLRLVVPDFATDIALKFRRIEK